MVDCELIVNVSPKEVEIALLEDKQLVELNKESRDITFSVGNIYVGRVKKIMRGLNAAFVDIGFEKDAFLHYLDLGPQFNSVNKFVTWNNGDRKKPLSSPKFQRCEDIDKEGVISDALTSGQNILVQIVKEPISTKGPRITSELSIAGRYLVLIPFSDKVSISQKITSTEEKARLKKMILSIKPKNFGVIVRTVAEGQKVGDLEREIKTLVKRWDDMIIKAFHVKAPLLVMEEINRVEAILRDLLNASFNNIYVNDASIYNEIKDYVALISPDKEDIVSHYNKEQPIFDYFGITKQIKSLFGRTVSYKNGAYLIIEHTEALHVVDVNSGNRSKGTKTQENNVLDVNLGAAVEVARQLRLRDMGGIIVVDFIDMGNPEFRQQLFDKMRDAMSQDRTKHNILPLSKFGLMQITRQRVRPEILINPSESCPSCAGTGTSKPSLLFCEELETKIDFLVNRLEIKRFTLQVHPYVAAYIEKGLFSLKWKWRLNYSMGIKILPIQSLPFLQYDFVGVDGEVIVLK